jgi:uncharacterized membrane protein YeiH
LEISFSASKTLIELGAVAAGSISGTLHAMERKFDIVGVGVIGIVTGIGGGLIRDALLGQPALTLQYSEFLLTAICASLIGAFFGSYFNRLSPLLWFADSLSLGLFTVAGVQRAIRLGLPGTSAILLGVITSVGGGLIRDVLCRETPAILMPGRPYALIAIISGCVYYSCRQWLHFPPPYGSLLSIGIALTLRYASVWFDWTVLPPQEIKGRFSKR